MESLKIADLIVRCAIFNCDINMKKHTVKLSNYDRIIYIDTILKKCYSYTKKDYIK